MNEKWLNKVSGKPTDIIIPLVMTVICTCLTVLMHGFIIFLIFTIGMALLSLYSIYYADTFSLDQIFPG